MLGANRTAYRLARQGGFTLLELLLVVTILSAVAWMSLGYVNNNGDQVRFEDTKNRLQAIRRAIIGDTSRTLNGQPVISGYVADMGEVPPHLQALIQREYCDGDPGEKDQGACETAGHTWIRQGSDFCSDPSYSSKSLCELNGKIWNEGYGYNEKYSLWSGWNGPYLNASALTGYPKFPDGWGNLALNGNNFGWNFTNFKNDGSSTEIHLLVQSLGRDGASGGDKYDDDYPSVDMPDITASPPYYSANTPPSEAERLISDNQYRVLVTDSSGNGGVTVDFGTPTISAPSTGSLCMRVAYRVNGVVTPFESSGSGAYFDASWDGSPKSTIFTFPNGTYFPLGEMVVGIYEYDSSLSPSCTDNIYPSTYEMKHFTIVPGTTPQTLSWKIL